jgi:hypothetical protein
VLAVATVEEAEERRRRSMVKPASGERKDDEAGS